MQSFCVNRTTKFIKSISMMKKEELLQCKLKIKTLEHTLENDYNSINLYKYRQANERFNNLKSTIIDLKMLELRINRKFKKFLGTINSQVVLRIKSLLKGKSKNELI
jgi:hypothetical protein